MWYATTTTITNSNKYIKNHRKEIKHKVMISYSYCTCGISYKIFRLTYMPGGFNTGLYVLYCMYM